MANGMVTTLLTKAMHWRGDDHGTRGDQQARMLIRFGLTANCDGGTLAKDSVQIVRIRSTQADATCA